MDVTFVRSLQKASRSSVVWIADGDSRSSIRQSVRTRASRELHGLQTSAILVVCASLMKGARLSLFMYARKSICKQTKDSIGCRLANVFNRDKDHFPEIIRISVSHPTTGDIWESIRFKSIRSANRK